MDPSDFAPLLPLIPAGAQKWLALIPVLQLVAKLLAPLPGRLGGFTHSTVWSRVWDTVAAFPAAPAGRPSPVLHETTPGDGAP